MTQPPTVIIGAPRSGTNILRDALVGLPGFGTWPCDEINLIWRHGNRAVPTDEFPPELARPEVVAYIRRSFARLGRSGRLSHVVEKTCANSLRVGFVDRVLPEARYLFIVRDGVDVVASARKRWFAKLELGYVVRKARFVPLGDVPFYASRFVANRWHRLMSRERRLAFWGPRLNDMPELLRRHSIEEVCALQWRGCVERAEADFAAIPPERVHRLRYESFARDPLTAFQGICDFLGVPLPESRRRALSREVSAGSVGRGYGDLGAEVVASIQPIIEPLQRRLGYL